MNQIYIKRMLYNTSFPDFNFESTYMPGLDPSDDLLYQIAAPLSTEPESKADDTCLCPEELSDELLYEIEAQFSEEQEDMINTSESLETLLQPPKNGCNTRTLRKNTHLGHYRNMYVFKPLATEL